MVYLKILIAATPLDPLVTRSTAKMASKRTRSAVQEPDGSSSKVTDYIGPYTGKKRRKVGNESVGNTAPKANSSARVAKSTTATRESTEGPQRKAASTRRQTRQQRVIADEEDEDDELVNVDHDLISSAINEARQRRPRTVNGLRSAVSPQAHNHTAENDEADVEEQERDRGFTANREPARQHDRPSKSKQIGPPNPQKRPNTRSSTEAQALRIDGYEMPSVPIRALRPRRKPAAQNKDGDQNSVSEQQERQQRQQYLKRSAAPAPAEQRDENSDASSSGVEDGEEFRARVAEDSAFIEAPQANEDLPGVRFPINSLGGMKATLGHSAWTGLRKWAVDSESNAQCKSSLGRNLMRYAEGLHDLLVEAINARNDEEDAEHAYAKTTDYLRHHSGDIKNHFLGVAELVGKICTRHLAPSEDLPAHAIKARRRLLRDASKRLTPVLVLVIEKACDLGLSETAGRTVYLTLDSFTLQFLLRTLGWTRRLQQAIARGLEYWPIDDEFTKNREELDEDEVKLKYEKTLARTTFEKQLNALLSAAKGAERALQDQAAEVARDRLQVQLRRQRLIRQREIWAARERHEEEEKERNAQRWEAFCKSTQALKHAPDPMKQLWDRAEEARRKYEGMHASVSGTPARGRTHEPEGRGKAVSQNDFVGNNEDPVAIDEDDDPFATPPIQRRHAYGNARLQHGIPGSAYSAQKSRASEAWDGLDWTREEERILFGSIRYQNDYDLVPMAARLNRSEHDVAMKAALFKATYREIYAERGAEIPSWAL